MRYRMPFMFEQAFKNIDDALWKESGCTTELDYTEQSSWLLFLKYLDALEAAVRARTLPRTQGFFFGASDGSELEDDLCFIGKAREALSAGLSVFYSSWW